MDKENTIQLMDLSYRRTFPDVDAFIGPFGIQITVSDKHEFSGEMIMILQNLYKVYKFGYDIASKDFQNYNKDHVYGLAMILAEQGLLNESSNLFQIIKESIREVPSSYFNQAIIMRAQGKTQDSIEAMKSYIKRFNNPTNYEPYLYLARALYDNKQFKELITIYTKCIQMDPTNIKLWYILAIAHTQYAAFIITVEKVHMLEFDEVKGVYPCCGREKGEEGCTTSRQRTVQEVASAVHSMITARDLFQWLYDEYDTFPNPPYQKKTAEAYFNSCSQNIEPAKAHLDYEIKQNEQLFRE